MWRRTQEQDERVVIYISIMENLFSNLVKLKPDAEKLNLIKGNMLSVYQPYLALSEITDVRSLSDTCRSLEEAHLAQRKFQPPPMGSLALESGLVYHSSASSKKPLRCQSCSCHLPAGASAEVRPSTSSHPPSTVRCWKCNETEHILCFMLLWLWKSECNSSWLLNLFKETETRKAHSRSANLSFRE